MGKTKENPRYNTITARVSEEEWQEVHEKAKILKISMSDYIRKKVFNGSSSS
jgi:hypothetical protein